MRRKEVGEVFGIHDRKRYTSHKAGGWPQPLAQQSTFFSLASEQISAHPKVNFATIHTMAGKVYQVV